MKKTKKNDINVFLEKKHNVLHNQYLYLLNCNNFIDASKILDKIKILEDIQSGRI